MPCLHLVYQSKLVSNLKLWVLRIKITFKHIPKWPKSQYKYESVVCLHLHVPTSTKMSAHFKFKYVSNHSIMSHCFRVTLLCLCQAGPVAKSKSQVSASILQTVDGVNAVISKEKTSLANNRQINNLCIWIMIYQCLSMIFGYNPMCLNERFLHCDTVTMEAHLPMCSWWGLRGLRLYRGAIPTTS